MASHKKKTASKKQPKHILVRASRGHVLPLFYEGSIIHIDDVNPVKLDLDALEHEPRIQVEQALADKHLIEESK